jgi:hypothetical protein
MISRKEDSFTRYERRDGKDVRPDAFTPNESTSIILHHVLTAIRLIEAATPATLEELDRRLGAFADDDADTVLILLAVSHLVMRKLLNDQRS